MPLSCPDIARVCKARLANVEANWPRIIDALEAGGIRTDLVEVAAAATVAVETAWTFRPINEFGGPAYFTKHYEGRKDLGNIKPGDGALFHGRGYIQITGRVNYRAYSQAAGVFLEDSPDLALRPDVAAKILVAYFNAMRIPQAAHAYDWLKVRRLVNGINKQTGLPNGWDEFKACVDGLLETLCGSIQTTPTGNTNTTSGPTAGEVR